MIQCLNYFFFQAEDGIRDRRPSRGLGDVYKRQILYNATVAIQLFHAGEDGTMEQTKQAAVGCVIMASGRAVRFGSDKLLADFGGAPAQTEDDPFCFFLRVEVAHHGLEALPPQQRLVAGQEDAPPVSYTHLTLPTKRIV